MSAAADAEAAAELDRAGLVYVSDTEPGITRRRSGRGFGYRWPDGRPVRDPEVLERIRKLAIPPAYQDVWIATDPRGHLQATGRDARGRKQYRYHPDWSAVRDETKYGRMLAFAEGLPRLRARVAEDLALPGLPKAKVMAAVVRLLERTLVRVGNESYVDENRSFGLTTLRKRHAVVAGTTIRFEFRAKGGKYHRVGLRSKRLARVLRRCQDLPGHRLFQYRDEGGEMRPIESRDVNEYLREVMGEDFTAKDFRTWAGTLLAAVRLSREPPPRNKTAARHVIVRNVKEVAAVLGNTPAVCRRCYIHPGLIDAYEAGTLANRLELPDVPDEELLATAERAVGRFLRRFLAEDGRVNGEARPARRRNRRGAAGVARRTGPSKAGQAARTR